MTKISKNLHINVLGQNINSTSFEKIIKNEIVTELKLNFDHLIQNLPVGTINQMSSLISRERERRGLHV